MFLVSLTSPTPFISSFFFFNDTATTEIYTLSLHDALPIFQGKTAPRGPSSLFGVRRIPQRRREEPDTLRAAFHSALRRRASGKNAVKHSFQIGRAHV